MHKIILLILSLVVSVFVSNAEEPQSFTDDASRRSGYVVFHPLKYKTTFSIGMEMCYFYYKEMHLMQAVVEDYQKYFYSRPEVEGEPKSTEHGFLPAFSFSSTSVLGQGRFFIKPGIAVYPGLRNSYDGSTQAEILYNSNGIPSGYKFKPVEQKKLNIFLAGQFLAGFARTSQPFSFSLYSGFRPKLWYRSLTDPLSEESEFLNISETYTWFSIPVGMTIYRPLGNNLVASIDGGIDFMFYGTMDVDYDFTEEGIIYKSDQVTLGNKACYRFEAGLQKKTGQHFAIRFSAFIQSYGFGKSNYGQTEISDYQGHSMTFSFVEPESGTIWGGISLTANLLKSSVPE